MKERIIIYLAEYVILQTIILSQTNKIYRNSHVRGHHKEVQTFEFYLDIESKTESKGNQGHSIHRNKIFGHKRPTAGFMTVISLCIVIC